MRKHGRLDSNQNMIVKRLRLIHGVSVLSVASQGNGAPDLLIGFRKTNFLIELKSDEKSSLTKYEALFHGMWKGQVCICRSFEDVLNAIGLE